MSAALKLNDLFGFDRNEIDDPGKHLPAGRTISREECMHLLPGVDDEDITGGFIWYDAQIYNTERLTLAVILSAATAGAVAANYVKATGFLMDGHRVKGVAAKDMLTGDRIKIRAKAVINAAGPWLDFILGDLPNHHQNRRFHHSVAMNLVTRQLFTDYAVAVPTRVIGPDGEGKSSQDSQMLFFVPWRDHSIIGTHHTMVGDLYHEASYYDERISRFLEDVNSAYPGGQLKREDVSFVHLGYLPAHPSNGSRVAKLVRRGQVYNHAKLDGVGGLVTMLGVKYTSARYIAEQAVDLASEMSGMKSSPSQTDNTPITGGDIERFDDFLFGEIKRRANELDKKTLRRLIYSYGRNYSQLLDSTEDGFDNHANLRQSGGMLKAEVLYAVRNEMALKLSDVIMRRTELGTAGIPTESCLERCADLMGAELGWDDDKKRREIEEARAYYCLETRMKLHRFPS
jgi:glycerol-3-phosphate dehydrogenase